MNLSMFISVLVWSLVASSIQTHASSSSFIDNIEKTNSDEMVYDVLKYGAKGDGKTDDSKAFKAAWDHACSSNRPSTVYVPQRTFLLNQVMFNRPQGGGPCKSITMQIDGELIASTDSNLWKQADKKYWLQFWGVDGLTVQGKGVLDGRGDSWWRTVTRESSNQGPPSLIFTHTPNTVIRGITSRNSKEVHIAFNGCNNCEVQGVTIQAPSTSPNTDGIRMARSHYVKIRDTHIGTGDDCIAMLSDTMNVAIDNIICGPGHGISVGSLGGNHERASVRNITVNGVKFVGTQNGARIKTRPGGTGFVTDITFENIQMRDVTNPIIIDQYYFSNPSVSKGESAVKISNVVYKSITGTSASNVGIQFRCSESAPCEGIRVENVKLTYKNRDAQLECCNAQVAPTFLCRAQSANCLK